MPTGTTTEIISQQHRHLRIVIQTIDTLYYATHSMEYLCTYVQTVCLFEKGSLKDDTNCNPTIQDYTKPSRRCPPGVSAPLLLFSQITFLFRFLLHGYC